MNSLRKKHRSICLKAFCTLIFFQLLGIQSTSAEPSVTPFPTPTPVNICRGASLSSCIQVGGQTYKTGIRNDTIIEVPIALDWENDTFGAELSMRSCSGGNVALDNFIWVNSATDSLNGDSTLTIKIADSIEDPYFPFAPHAPGEYDLGLAVSNDQCHVGSGVGFTVEAVNTYLVAPTFLYTNPKIPLVKNAPRDRATCSAFSNSARCQYAGYRCTDRMETCPVSLRAPKGKSYRECLGPIDIPEARFERTPLIRRLGEDGFWSSDISDIVEVLREGIMGGLKNSSSDIYEKLMGIPSGSGDLSYGENVVEGIVDTVTEKITNGNKIYGRSLTLLVRKLAMYRFAFASVEMEIGRAVPEFYQTDKGDTELRNLVTRVVAPLSQCLKAIQPDFRTENTNQFYYCDDYFRTMAPFLLGEAIVEYKTHFQFPVREFDEFLQDDAVTDALGAYEACLSEALSTCTPGDFSLPAEEIVSSCATSSIVKAVAKAKIQDGFSRWKQSGKKLKRWTSRF